MDSLVYKTLLTDFQRGLQRAVENIELAADGDLAGADRIEAVAAARRKLHEYEQCLAVLDQEPEILRQQFTDQFEYDLQCLRRDLALVGDPTS